MGDHRCYHRLGLLVCHGVCCGVNHRVAISVDHGVMMCRCMFIQRQMFLGSYSEVVVCDMWCMKGREVNSGVIGGVIILGK